MLKKIFLVLIILLPSALYLYIVSRDSKAPQAPASAEQAAPQPQAPEYQTPDH
ncbi:hypothetical protein [Acinetobacter indicus]|uniref:hypothetical protein n=1 Tax=Acinetobacter indicus TaxID=756892 RepID=UPI00148EDE30|nr:hypothetical protein [Acinetobacter indicus]